MYAAPAPARARPRGQCRSVTASISRLTRARAVTHAASARDGVRREEYRSEYVPSTPAGTGEYTAGPAQERL